MFDFFDINGYPGREDEFQSFGQKVTGIKKKGQPQYVLNIPAHDFRIFQV
jgi:hypothetical protein